MFDLVPLAGPGRQVAYHDQSIRKRLEQGLLGCFLDRLSLSNFLQIESHRVSLGPLGLGKQFRRFPRPGFSGHIRRFSVLPDVDGFAAFTASPLGLISLRAIRK